MKLVLVVLLVVVLATPGLVALATASSQWYPCVRCHSTISVNASVSSSSYHNITLSGGHQGLVCSSCHKPPLMEEMRGNVSLSAYFAGDHMELNKLCKVCHVREYEDYQLLVHGNKTIVCPGSKILLVKGYKGVIYQLHLCSNYDRLSPRPAKACIDCHNPHNPHLNPLPPLPSQSRRPPPPDETPLAYSSMAVVASSLTLIIVSAIVGLAEKSGGGSSG